MVNGLQLYRLVTHLRLNNTAAISRELQPWPALPSWPGYLYFQTLLFALKVKAVGLYAHRLFFGAGHTQKVATKLI